MLFEAEPNEVLGLKTNSGKQSLLYILVIGSGAWIPAHSHLKLRELWSVLNYYGYYTIMASFNYGYIPWYILWLLYYGYYTIMVSFE